VHAQGSFFLFSTKHGVIVMKNWIINLLNDEEGATAIEYALIAAILSIGILTSLGTVRDNLVAVLGRISTALTGA